VLELLIKVLLVVMEELFHLSIQEAVEALAQLEVTHHQVLEAVLVVLESVLLLLVQAWLELVVVAVVLVELERLVVAVQLQALPRQTELQTQVAVAVVRFLVAAELAQLVAQEL
jgi:hypothetical protein